MLYHDEEFRIVVCTKAEKKAEEKKEEVNIDTIYRRILNEDCDVCDL